MTIDLDENTSPETESFCVSTELPTSIPVIRFPGGHTIEPQIDPNDGTPSSCALTLDVVGQLNSALAPFRPFLTVLDMVSHLAQCFLLLVEVVTNPFKIPKLLACIPQLVDKINAVLALVPIFPQGIAAFITFIVDILRFAATQLDCIIQMLGSIQRQIEEIDRLRDRAVQTDDPFVVTSLEQLIACSEQEVATQTSLALSALGPIARLLCVIRAILTLIPGGRALAESLAFPDPSDITQVEAAIFALETVRDILLAAVDAAALLSPLGVQAPPPLVFTCPLDVPSDEEEEEEVPEPSITTLLNSVGSPVGFFPNPPVPQSSGPDDADYRVQIVGTNFTSTSRVFWGTAPIDDTKIVGRASTFLTVDLSAELRINVGDFLLSVVNSPTGGTLPFAGLSETAGGEEPESSTKVSNSFQVEVG